MAVWIIELFEKEKSSCATQTLEVGLIELGIILWYHHQYLLSFYFWLSSSTKAELDIWSNFNNKWDII